MSSSNKLVPVFTNSIQNAKPLVFPLYAKDGSLLANKGTTLSQDQTLKILSHGDIFTPESDLVAALENSTWRRRNVIRETSKDSSYKIRTTWEKLEILKADYELWIDTDRVDIEQSIFYLSNKLDKIIQQNENSALAYVFLKLRKNCKQDFMLSLGILISILTINLRWKEKERLIILSAALLIDHGEAGASYFNRIGVSHKKTLNYLINIQYIGENNKVEVHPHVEDLDFSNTLFNTVYLYHALQHKYKNSDVNTPDVTIKMLSNSGFSRYGKYMIKQIIETIGLYPSGCFVKLANKEIAVVQHKGSSPNLPAIRIIMAENGVAQRQTPTTMANQSNNKIVKVIEPANILNFVNTDGYWQ